VVGYDRSHDIAVLQAQGASGLPTASIGDSDTVSIGDRIAAVAMRAGSAAPPPSRRAGCQPWIGRSPLAMRATAPPSSSLG
jgi:hypothetical protein